ncbi:MAG: FAD-dependent monooxygenase [Prolixibacteraceae bacterium]|jgi:2-polyprenyl-6-methoxyphenol hydroxylase-like FAD-dependent oxidoreductase
MANSSDTINSTDILIVGAGPSGLMMACQLALYDISFRIIDKKAEPTNYSGALIVHARSLEIFKQMGIAEKAIQKGIIAGEIKISFNAKKSFVIPIRNLGGEQTEFPFMLLLEQSVTEKLLIQFLQERGIQVERKIELLKIQQDSDKVISVLKSEHGEETVHAKYLIGADGARSIVRKLLQIPFTGKSYLSPLFVADCVAETDFPHDQICFSFSNLVTTGLFPLKNGRWRIDGAFSGAKSDLTFEDIQQNFSERAGISVKLKTADWFSVFQTNSRVAEHYRQSHCFLVGDAAHIHSPVGAQGMNTGLQDAANLAWKLAAVVQGKADEKLLETYELERRKIAQNIVRYTDWVFDFVTTQNMLIRFFRLHLVPVFLKLLYPALTKNTKLRGSFFRKLSGLTVHYRKSSLSVKASAKGIPDSAPKPGERLPFLTYLESGKITNIQDKITGTTFHLLFFSRERIPEEIIRFEGKNSEVLAIENIFFSVETQNLFELFGVKNSGFYLIRPDGYVALRSAKPDIAQLENYFQRINMNDFPTN